MMMATMKKVTIGSQRPPGEKKDATWRYTLGYFALGATWILVTDTLVMYGKSPARVEMFSTLKGLVYVALTALLLYAMMRHNAKALRTANQDLEHRVAERTRELQALNDELKAFTYSVSHDLRAPLRSINGFCYILKEDYSERLSQEGVDYLERIRDATVQMGALIDGLLDLSRASQTELSVGRVSLSDLAEAAVAGLRTKQPDRAVDVTIEPDMVVAGDARLLANLVGNLFDNAWKFTAQADTAVIRFNSQENGRGRVFCVEDNGIGFSAADVSELFLPFKRLGQATEFAGEGIGLATVRRIVQRHGGEVWAEGEEGRGARFCFTLGKPIEL